MSVPEAPASAPTSMLGVLTRVPLALNWGSSELRLVVPAGSGSSSTITCEQVKSAVSWLHTSVWNCATVSVSV